MALASVQCPYCKNKVDILHFAPTISCPCCKKTFRLQRRASAQQRTPAQLQPHASPECAALRLWAVSIRDNVRCSRNTRDDGKALVSLLDASLDMKPRHPQLAGELWASALKLATKISTSGYWLKLPPELTPRDGDWHPGPPR
jgi:hypothetical protein